MATASIDGLRLYYELGGTGPVPLVLVHGSWGTHAVWHALAPRLSDAFRVLTYDRRGHGASNCPATQGSVHEDVADLAALIETLELAPAWVIGSSFGGSIALRLAGARPEILRGLVVHEPPLLGLLAGDPALAPLLAEVGQRIGAVVDRIAGGDHAGAAELFVDTVALGPDMWAQMPPAARQMLIDNAPTFLDEARDPDQLLLDVAALRGFTRPALLTLGALSPPFFAPIIDRLSPALPHAEVQRFPDAGHIPHETVPDTYAAALRAFIAAHPA